jgi:CDP-6-deoxy-D-xylo-4-hexulose-3-dehydrase
LGYDHIYTYSHFGYNLKPTDLQAAIGCAQLDKLDEFVRIRRENFAILYQGLKNLEEFFILPQPTKDSEPSWFGFLLTIREGAPFSRNEITARLESQNIQTRNLFAGNITLHPCFDDLKEGRDYRISGDLRHTDDIMQNSFWIGVYPGMKREALIFMIESIHDFVGQKLKKTASARR